MLVPGDQKRSPGLGVTGGRPLAPDRRVLGLLRRRREEGGDGVLCAETVSKQHGQRAEIEPVLPDMALWTLRLVGGGEIVGSCPWEPFLLFEES